MRLIAMVEYVKKILTDQFEAALCMIDHCIRACPPQHWEGKIAAGTFRWVAYHTLFWVDFSLSPGDEDAFVLRDLHHRGGDERENVACPGLSKDETLAYIAICRQKMLETLAGETAESLQGPCGFSYWKITRGELYVHSIRHVQHHTGQLSAFLRRVVPALRDPEALPWIGTGWK
jgi:hypothetical protein